MESNLIDFLEDMLDNQKSKDEILNNISHYFSNCYIYIKDWRIKERNRRIREEYEKRKFSDLPKYQIIDDINKTLSKEFRKRKIYVKITPKIIRYQLDKRWK